MEITGKNMMGYGNWGGMMGYGSGGLLAGLLYIIVVVLGVLAIIWLWKQINK